MMKHTPKLLCLVATLACCSAQPPAKLSVFPHDPLLFGRGSHQALVVIARYADGTEVDVTDRCRYQSQRASIATVDAKGIVHAKRNGASIIRVAYGGQQATTTALIQRADALPPVSFAAQILPILTKIGCNSGACHGAFHGQNGFKLSLFGYEPEADYNMIVRMHGSRRVNLLEPEQSLILLKPSFQIRHGGGQVLPKNSEDYSALLNWIRAGAPSNPATERRMISLRVTPNEAVLYGRNTRRRLLVTARYSDDTESDVTEMVKFQSNDDALVSISREGIVTGLRGGETAIVVRGPGVVTCSMHVN